MAHYRMLLRKFATWSGLAALMASLFVAMPASALGNQLGPRSVTPSTLKSSTASVSYAVTFKVSATSSGGTVGSVKFEICDSPLESVSCAASATANTNSKGADLTGASFTSLTGTACTGGTWVANGAGTGPGTSGTSFQFKNTGTAINPTSANACTFTMGGVRNPDGNNQHFYLRLTTYSDTNNTTEVDFGGFALQTAQDLSVQAYVQESLTFCVGATATANCASVGSGTIDLGTGSGCDILSTSNVCTGTSEMRASTNANSGYSITYNGTTFAGPSDTITAIGSTPAASSPGTKQFGLAGTAKSGGSGAWNTTGTNYDFGANGGDYAYVTGSPQVIAAASAATAETDYTVTYAANVDNTTKPGKYTATINYVCTGLF